jgi:hypothetical protein
VNRVFISIGLGVLATGMVLAVLLLGNFLGWDISLFKTVHAPTLLATLIRPSQPGTQIIGNGDYSPRYYHYVEVTASCGPYFGGECVNLRSGPGEEYPSVLHLRTGMVLKVEGVVHGATRDWYKIELDSEVRYPERVTTDWYVAADVVALFSDDGDHQLEKGSATTTKHIVVDRSEQMLYSYDGEALFMQTPISTGLEFTPTPRGTFTVYKMTPSRYMQGPLPGVSDQYYDLPGVPWNLYFTKGGAVIHGAYWHDHFGIPWSHGCVNVPLEQAKKLYLWADIGTKVVVQE